VLQLLKIMDGWIYNLDHGLQIHVIYTDFKKAFNKVPHQALISKLKAYNLNNTLLLWIQDFLCNCKKRVIVNGTYSQWYSVASGIPQGSILGPLQILIYINDLTTVTQKQILECTYMQMMQKFTVPYLVQTIQLVCKE